MARQPHEGRLELTWTNKHLRLLAREDDGYEWVSPSDYRVSEVRLLSDAGMVDAHASPDLVADLHGRATSVVQAPRRGGHSPRGVSPRNPRRAKANLLIRGDALNALTSLTSIPEFADEHVGKVKLVYLDPPFNTQQAFEQYDDALEHSVWLTMMRDRLNLVKKLLRPDGSVWVHCDDYEQHHLRCVLDEVFGASSFIATILWQKRYSRDNRPAVGPVHDFIHVYAPMGTDWKLVRSRIPRLRAKEYRNPNNDPKGPWRPIPLDAQAGHATAAQFYEIVTPSGARHKPPKGRCWSVTKARFEQLVGEGRVYFGLDGRGKPNLIRYLKDDKGLVPWTWWPHDEVGHNDESKKEILALFPDRPPFDTPKPERLMQRIIHLASQPGEVVLDCFLGSATTVAVAHKMGRRWIGVEWKAETLDTYAIPRLTRVVEGRDPGGITESVGWEGGGGFRILDVSHSMFIEDAGSVVLAEWATNGRLAEVTAAQFHYDLEDDPPFIGRKGKMRLAVVDGLVNEDVVKLLIDALPSGERVIVAGTAVDPLAGGALRASRPGSNVRKIPTSILRGYVDRARWAPAIAKEGASSSVG